MPEPNQNNEVELGLLLADQRHSESMLLNLYILIFGLCAFIFNRESNTDGLQIELACGLTLVLLLFSHVVMLLSRTVATLKTFLKAHEAAYPHVEMLFSGYDGRATIGLAVLVLAPFLVVGRVVWELLSLDCIWRGGITVTLALLFLFHALPSIYSLTVDLTND